ncbi:hypothetical protein PI125_g24977 [Phytophthora idaei]|nr:hypothetical protein PI125_g24977 [Phytophthora idaei]KAG3125047.1 hypothetical protein PI126_g22950 [Phytophthora idaei]
MVHRLGPRRVLQGAESSHVTVKIWTSEAKEDNIEDKTPWVSLRSRNRAANRGAGGERTCRHNAAVVPDDVRSHRRAANRGAGGERSCVTMLLLLQTT